LSLRGGVRLDTLKINVAGGQEFWLRTKDLKEYKTPRGLKYFVFSLPNGIEEYARLSKNSLPKLKNYNIQSLEKYILIKRL
jgi:hypothetical protein